MTEEPETSGLGRHRHDANLRGGLAAASLLGKVIAALLSAALLLGIGYFWYNYTSLDNGLHRVAVSGLGGETPEPTASGSTKVSGTAQNILLIGNDSRLGLTRKEEKEFHVGSDEGTTSTDTLMIIHVPADGSKATLISIPRDSYVDIPGHPKNKINAAFADGYYYTDGATTDDARTKAGLDLLIATIKQLTGLPIDHYVMVSFLGFYNIAKAIGGIPVNLCHDVDDTTARNIAENNGAVGSGFKMSAGHHDLTPVQSLEFVRQRHNLPGVGNDLGREARQRYFLAAAFKKMSSAGVLLNPGKLNDLVGAIKSTLTIDQNFSLASLADQMINLNGGNIVGQSIPTDGNKNFGGTVGDATLVDRLKVQAQIQKWINPAARKATATTPAPGSRSSAPTTPSGSTGSGGASSSASGAVTQADPSKGCIN